MGLTADILQDFANVVTQDKDQNAVNETYGTVHLMNGRIYVHLDGANEDVYTPVAQAVEVKEGDRVLVTIKNRRAIITGNISTRLSLDLTDIVDGSVANTQVLYALGDTTYTAPETGWSERAPDWTDGMYMWQKTIVTYNDGTTSVKGPTCISGATGLRGEDATILRIDSSKGTVFKNSNFGTVFTVVIWRGPKQITDIEALHAEYGIGAYLSWKWKRYEENDFHEILSSDNRISRNGFQFEVSPNDVDEKIVFQCDLVV